MRRLIMLLLCSLLLFTVGCDFGSDNNSKRDIILYSTLEPKFTEELLAVYNEKNKKTKNFQAVKAIYDEFFGEPGSHKAHEILHTSYVKRDWT